MVDLESEQIHSNIVTMIAIKNYVLKVLIVDVVHFIQIFVNTSEIPKVFQSITSCYSGDTNLHGKLILQFTHQVYMPEFSPLSSFAVPNTRYTLVLLLYVLLNNALAKLPGNSGSTVLLIRPHGLPLICCDSEDLR